MKKLALLAFTLFSAWNMDAKTITGPVDYVSPLVGRPSLGNELLGSPDRKNGGWLGIYL